MLQDPWNMFLPKAINAFSAALQKQEQFAKNQSLIASSGENIVSPRPTQLPPFLPQKEGAPGKKGKTFGEAFIVKKGPKYYGAALVMDEDGQPTETEITENPIQIEA